MICNRCGASLPDNATFCGVCGTKLEQNKTFCQRCGMPLEGDERFCSNCGEPTSPNVYLCNYCGNPIDINNAAFCENCGAPIAAPQFVPAPPSEKLRTEIKRSVAGKKPGFRSDDRHWSLASVLRGLSSKNRLILISSVILAVCLAVGIGFLSHAIYMQTPAGMMSSGMKYLSDCEYEQAIFEFDKILTIDPMNTDAYINKAKAYLSLGDIDSAIDTLHEGFRLTGSEEIKELIDEYENLIYGIVGGNVKDKNDMIIPQVNVTATMIADSAAINFSVNDSETGAEVGSKYKTRTNSKGFWSLILPRGLYSISFEKNGYIATSMYCEIYPGEVDVIGTTVLYDSTYSNTYMEAKGQVINGLNYQEVGGATVKFRQGWDNRTGEYVRFTQDMEYNHNLYGYSNLRVGDPITVTTDSYGYFNAMLKCGMYTAEISKDGFNTSYMNISTSEYTTRLLLTPHLDDNEYRIILTWGEIPSDLDSHFTGTYDGDSFEVFYRNNIFRDKVNLDIDDTTSFGPETITVSYNSSFGDCHYYVHDYTNQGMSLSEYLSNSQARVIVYKGNNLVGTYDVPTGKQGTIWHVFSIIDGRIIVHNTIDNERD